MGSKPDKAADLPSCDSWLVHCRAGYEGNCAAELTEYLHLRGVPAAYAMAARGEAWLRLVNPMPENGPDLATLVPDDAIFPRQIIPLWRWLEALPTADRVTAIIEALPAGRDFNGLQISYPDSNEGKSLGRLIKPLSVALRQGMRSRGITLERNGAPCLHLFFPDGRRVSIGHTRDDREPVGGVMRLRMPGAAPSRSTLKLDEAFRRLMGEEERESLLSPGQRAVDLGAAPGGWTWQMVRRHIHVTAVDNGPMAPELMESGLVTHVRADGFTWRPERAVDWLLCDIVDKPARVGQRMSRWLVEGWTRHAVFNLKLPMKQAWPTVRDLLRQLREELAESRPTVVVRARHLYHDREEITVIALDKG